MDAGIRAAILRAPDEDGPRLVLADELLARGDPLGEVVALQCRQAALGLHFEPGGAARLRALWAQHGAAARARLVPAPPQARVAFHRGLPALARCTAEAWLAAPDPQVPLQTLELEDVTAQHVVELLGRPSTARLAGLRLRSADSQSLGAAVLLLSEAKLPRLEHLALLQPRWGREASLTFFSSPLAAQLTSLELSHALAPGPLAVVQALAANGTRLEELSLEDDLPASLAPSLLHLRTVLFPDSFVQPQLAELLAPRVGLYLPPHVAPPATRGGPRAGGWQSVTPLGVRAGLDASYARHEVTGLGGLLLRTRSLTGDVESPVQWLEPRASQVDGDACTLGPIDAGVTASGQWAVFALASGERLDRLYEREGKLPLSAVAHAAAWSRVARWTVEHQLVTPVPLSQLYAGPRGLQVQPLCAELRSLRRGAARFTRREFIELSPEAVRGQPLDEKNATWVLAMQLCLTLGVKVFRDTVRTDLELLQQIMNGPQIDLYGHGLPSRLREMLKASLNRDRAMRPPPAALADALASFDSAPARDELALLATPTHELDRAREQAEAWLTGISIHEPEPIT